MKTFHSYIDLVNIWVTSHPEMTIKWDNSSRILGMLYFCTKLIKTCCNDLILSLIISTWIPKWMFQLTCCNLFLSRILKKKSFYVYEFLWKGIPEASFTVIFRRERRAWMSEDRREKRGEGWMGGQLWSEGMVCGVAGVRVKTNPGYILRIAWQRWDGAEGHGVRGQERGQGGHRSHPGARREWPLVVTSGSVSDSGAG